jgi:hypothetical protein
MDHSATPIKIATRGEIIYPESNVTFVIIDNDG